MIKHLLKFLFLPAALVCVYFFYGCVRDIDESIENQLVIPTTTVIPEPADSSTPRRVKDLGEIVIALEKYKRDNQSYPITSSTTDKWDRYASPSGEINPTWISGLVPKYIESLPRDPRMDVNFKRQYAYRSNGANYKLLALRPDDCDVISIKFPNLIDPMRGCAAYGYWTRNAGAW